MVLHSCKVGRGRTKYGAILSLILLSNIGKRDSLVVNILHLTAWLISLLLATEIKWQNFCILDCTKILLVPPN